jgi:hypothetical protein
MVFNVMQRIVEVEEVQDMEELRRHPSIVLLLLEAIV